MSDEKPNEVPVTIVIGVAKGLVVVQWAEPACTITFDPDSADQFADAIKARAQQCRNMQASEGVLTKH